MAFADLRARLNAVVVSRLGETITYRGADGSRSISAVLILDTVELAETMAFERRPTAEIDSTDLDQPPAQGDLITQGDGTRWMVDRYDAVEGMYVCILRADPLRD